MRITLGGESWKEHAPTLNNVAAPFLLSPYELSLMVNIRADGPTLVKRGGTVAVGTAANASKPLGLWLAYRADGTATPVRYQLGGNGTFYYSTDNTTWPSTTLTGWSTTLYPSAAVYQGSIFWCNGSDTPKRSSLSSPTTISTWGTLPTDFNPSWVIAYGNRLYAGGDTSTPNRVHFSDFGDPLTWQEQNFYSFPDNQNGGSPVAAAEMPKGIILFGADFVGTLTGYSELDHELQPWPRRSALLSKRGICNMGGSAAYGTPEGPELFDGTSMPRPLDAFHRVNWGDANMVDPNDIWFLRTGPWMMRCYFKSRGLTKAAASATVSVGRLVASMYAYVVSFLTRSTTPPSAISHYYEYNFVTDSWSGPHDGAHSCGEWETFLHGDRQYAWVAGVATGLVMKADQEVYTDADNSSKPYEAIVRTGGFGLDPSKKYKINQVDLVCSTSAMASGVRVRVYGEGQTHKFLVEETGDRSATSVDNAQFCTISIPLQERNVMTKVPQVEIRELSTNAFVIYGITIDVEEVV